MMTARQRGGIVIVRDGDGHRIATHNAVVLAKEWLRLGGGKAFKLKYGFRWDPPWETMEEAKRQMQAE